MVPFQIDPSWYERYWLREQPPRHWRPIRSLLIDAAALVGGFLRPPLSFWDTGEKYPDSTSPAPAGSFVSHLGREIHYDGAKEDEVSLLIIGEGPEAPTPPPVR